tara:strand:- start:393 stop:614 length:222 start_codon:yes stop_codon:yes gene_type:complete
MTINDIDSSIRMKYNLKMGIDGVIEPIYFLITSIGFVILSFIQYKKTGKTLETIYLSILAIFFMLCFIILNFY